MDGKPKRPDESAREIATAFSRGELSQGEFQKMLTALEVTNKNPMSLPPDVGIV